VAAARASSAAAPEKSSDHHLPGPVRTGVWTDPDGFIARRAQENGVEHDAFAERLMSSMGASTGRMTTPQEVARLIAFAASPSNITGADFLLDGGVIKSA
jgi:NAD(P)-dependent dehydrogenase (short-subunit alcohol dehydrogenase family)